MKVYSWKTLFAALLAIAYMLYEAAHFRGFASLVLILFFLYLTVRAFGVAFSEEACRKDQEKAAQAKKVWVSLFGKAGPWVPYLPFLLLAAAVGTALARPTWVGPVLALWGGFILFSLALIGLFYWQKARLKRREEEIHPEQKEK